jgi:hypothetical protein
LRAPHCYGVTIKLDFGGEFQFYETLEINHQPMSKIDAALTTDSEFDYSCWRVLLMSL